MESQERSGLKPNNAFSYRLIKRLFVIVFSFILLLPLSPLILVIAMAVWIADVRPFFFTQRRAGLNRELFFIYKYRTMVPNAPDLRNEHLSSAKRNSLVRVVRNASLWTELRVMVKYIFAVLTGRKWGKSEI